MNKNRKYIRIEPMHSDKGNFVKNAYIINAYDSKFLQSYEDIVAEKTNVGKILLSKNFYNSTPTTITHLENFLEMDIDIIRWEITNEKIELVDFWKGI